MPYELIRNDITKMRVDAIVNAANESLLGGGVDGAIHRAAGPGLLAECRTLGGCATGEAKITGGYNLPCRYVIHTVGPVWQGGKRGEAALLTSCYRKSLELALQNGCQTVAFPLISAGVYGYPKDQALKIAMDTVADFLAENDLTVYIVLFDRASLHISEKLYRSVAQYVDDHYVETHTGPIELRRARSNRAGAVVESVMCAPGMAVGSAEESLEERLNRLDEGFSRSVLRLIDEKGMTDAQCYRKAGLDRKLFSKIRGDAQYRPGKRTALALAVALELDIHETEALLKKAGLALSPCSKFDVIVEYFIRAGRFDVIEINQALFEFDQQLLGA